MIPTILGWEVMDDNDEAVVRSVKIDAQENDGEGLISIEDEGECVTIPLGELAWLINALESASEILHNQPPTREKEESNVISD